MLMKLKVKMNKKYEYYKNVKICTKIKIKPQIC